MRLFKSLAFGTALASCCMAGRPVLAQAHPQSVTIGWFGGNWGESFNACIADPFTKATGIRVVPEIGTSTVNLSKLVQQKSSPIIDAVWMDGGVSELAMAAGVLDEMRPVAIPNMANLVPQGVYAADGQTFAVSTGYYALGITYNANQVKVPPTSWADLWKPEFADAVTFPSPANALGVPTVYFLNKAVTPSHDMNDTFARLKTLKAAQFYDSSGAAANAFQSGEAVIGVFNSAPTWEMSDKGLPMRFVAPKEGAWGGDVRLHLVKGARNRAAAEAFINAALSPEASSCLARRLYLGPAVKGVSVPDEVARKLPWGVGGSVADLQLLDWWDVNKQRAGLVDRWNREIARK